MLSQIIRFFLENKLVAYLLLFLFVGWGLATAPFDFGLNWLPRDPVAVDAIPDIGENQQIVFTQWAGRSPQNVEDQITYPLTTALLGIPGVKSIRSNSMFGRLIKKKKPFCIVLIDCENREAGERSGGVSL